MRLWFTIFVLAVTTAHGAEEPISFNKHIRPILADRCFSCHGPDAANRKAGLRLDQQQYATGKLEDSGNIAIVPGNPAASELLHRLTDPDQRMPPPESNLSVSPQETALIRKWIEQGATWERHWAFIPPKTPMQPRVDNQSWPISELDTFVLHRLESQGLKPEAPADRQRWLRRVTFDLTGLPPTISEMNQFLKDPSDQAHSRVVDRLLNSNAFGERMAVEWLDVARYGDTDGLFEDHVRSIYPWRDWVVHAFNTNLPYNDFITWQVAGDLLPNATVAQRTATGFLRNNPTSNEGGIIDEDYRVKYLIDRVNTTATAMLGLTLECAQCHDHKYDPMTQREYFQFAGFFNNLVGNGNTRGATAPVLRNLKPSQTARMKLIDQQLATLNNKLNATPPELVTDFEKWVKEIQQPIAWSTALLEENGEWESRDNWIVAKKTASSKQPEPSTPSAVKGRFVRIMQPAEHTGYLTISEVQVFASGINIAPAGKATQSSVAYNSPASKAINGNHDGSFGSCACTAEEKAAWWELDLGASAAIDSIVVWNRTDCCPERLDHIAIQVLDEKRELQAERVLTKAANRNALPADAKQPATNMQEVEFVFATKPGNLAALRFEGKTPSQTEVLSVTLHPADKSAKPVEVKLTGNLKLNLFPKPSIVALEKVANITEGQQVAVKIRTTALSGLRISMTDNE
ncbi:MAG: DUF1549 domain-containing protein, partial [Planctomycetota bacterium]|nr:DUF1549 domain-containing protein [Planctomycetota bacterium]